MDLIIQNLDNIRYFGRKQQPKTITDIDNKKFIEDNVEFNETFKNTCEKYKTVSVKTDMTIEK